MLGKLFGSNARVKILKKFLLHPEQKHYIRQLARDLGLQVNSVRRELENLEELGLLISKVGTGAEADDADYPPVSAEETKKKSTGHGQEKKYYQANENFVLFEEIKALIIKAQILYEKNFINKLIKIGKPKLLILTGLFVNKANSATDILIVGRLNKNKLSQLLKELEKDLGQELNFTLMDNGEFKYRRDITDVFLYDVLEGKKIVVIDETGLH